MHLDALLFVAVIIIAASAITTIVFSRAGFGSILGLLITGVVVGPWGLEVSDHSEDLRHVAELGVVFLLFIIGLELHPRRLWLMRYAVFGLGTMQVAVTGIILMAILQLFSVDWRSALILGLGLSLSSTAMVMKMLEERGEIVTPHGRHAFAILLLQDLAIVPFLALVPLIAPIVGDDQPNFATTIMMQLAAIGIVIALGSKIMPWALELVARHRNMEAFALLSILSVLLAAWLMTVAGLSMALGGFLMGLMLSSSRFQHQIEADVSPFKGILLSLFFVSIGMSIDLGLLVESWPLILGAVVTLVVVKILVTLAATLAFRPKLHHAIRVATVLAQGGEFGFVLFGAAVVSGVITSNVYVIAVLVIALSMMVTPILTRYGAVLAKGIEERTPDTNQLHDAAAEMDRHVVVAGYGRVGETIVRLLEAADIPYVGLDRNPELIRQGQQRGHTIHFGNAANPRILANAGMARAAALVITLDDAENARRVAFSSRNFYPDVTVLARVRDLEARESMIEAGVAEAVPEVTELSLAMGEAVLTRVGVPEEEARDAVRQLRANEFQGIRLDELPSSAGQATA